MKDSRECLRLVDVRVMSDPPDGMVAFGATASRNVPGDYLNVSARRSPRR